MDHNSNNLFPELLRAARKRKKLTQQQVSDAVGIKRSAYAYYELGKSEPNIENLKRIADVLEVSCDCLVDSTKALASPKIQYDSDNGLFTSIDFEIIKRLKELDDDQKQDVLDRIKELLCENGNTDKK